MPVRKKKYPKRPKASASIEVMQRYLQRCKEVDKDNAQLKKDASKKESLRKQIQKVGRAR